MDYKQISLTKHEELVGKVKISSKAKCETLDDLSIYYSPGVSAPCEEIYKDKELVYKYTNKSNTVAIISDGSAVLGLGNIGAEASLPVMEGKSMLFDQFASISAFPLSIEVNSPEDVINFCKMVAPSVGGILLEDISSPNCVKIERALQELPIPVFHDDQHGTAIVVSAALINLLKVTGKKIEDLKILVSGTGAAGCSIIRMLKFMGAKSIIANNIHGMITKDNQNLQDNVVSELIEESIVNFSKEDKLLNAIDNCDLFVGVSVGNILTKEMIGKMNKDPWVFALANPVPEVTPEIAMEAGAGFVATGRSDYPNQINNVLAFPGLFKGALETREQITIETKLLVANAIAQYVQDPSIDRIIPNTLDKGLAVHIYDCMIKDFNERN